MYEIVKEDDMKNINQNKGNNGNLILDNEVLESTKSSNQIIVLVANRSEIRKPESEAFYQPLYQRIKIFLILINL
jgi:hypothetical protein